MEREERCHGLGSHSSYLVGGMRTTGSPPVAPGEPGEVFISPASQRAGGIRIIWEDLGERYSWHVSATTIWLFPNSLILYEVSPANYLA